MTPEDDPRALFDQTSGFRRALTSRCAADKYDFVLKATHLNLLSRPARCLSPATASWTALVQDAGKG